MRKKKFIEFDFDFRIWYSSPFSFQIKGVKLGVLNISLLVIAGNLKGVSCWVSTQFSGVGDSNRVFKG